MSSVEYMHEYYLTHLKARRQYYQTHQKPPLERKLLAKQHETTREIHVLLQLWKRA